MPSDSQSYVAHGPGTGSATVLGQPGDAFDLIKQRKSQQQAIEYDRQKVAQAAQQKERENNQKRFNELMDLAQPEFAFEPFNQQIADDMSATTDWLQSQISAGKLPSDVEADFKKRLTENKLLTAKADELKKTTADLYKVLDDNKKFYDYDVKKQQVVDRLYDESGKPKSLKELDVQKLYEGILEDPTGFNLGEYGKSIVDNLGTEVVRFAKDQATQAGIVTKDYEQEVKAGLFEIDENGRVVMENGKPKYRVNQNVIDYFLSNPTAANAVDQLVEKYNLGKGILAAMNPLMAKHIEQIYGNQNRETVITDIIRNFNAFKTKETEKLNPKSESQAFTERAKALNLMNLRAKALNDINTMFIDESGVRQLKPTEDGIKALSMLTNATIAGSKVLDVNAISGYDRRTKIMGMPIPSDLDRDKDYVVFKLKDAGRRKGQHALKFVPVGQDGTIEEVFNYFNAVEDKGGVKNEIPYFQFQNYVNDIESRGIPVIMPYKGSSNPVLEVDEEAVIKDAQDPYESVIGREEEFIGAVVDGEEILNVEPIAQNLFQSTLGYTNKIRFTIKDANGNLREETVNSDNNEFFKNLLFQNPGLITPVEGNKPKPKPTKPNQKPEIKPNVQPTDSVDLGKGLKEILEGTYKRSNNE